MFAAGLICAIFIFASELPIWEFGIVILVIAVTNALILLAIAELIMVLADISISTRATLNHFADVTLRKTQEENKQ